MTGSNVKAVSDSQCRVLRLLRESLRNFSLLEIWRPLVLRDFFYSSYLLHIRRESQHLRQKCFTDPLIHTEITEQHGSPPSSYFFLWLMHMQHMPTQLLHINTLADCVSQSDLFCPRDRPRKQFFFFYCFSLIMTYLFRTRDQCTTRALSQQEEKVVEPEKEWVLPSCRVYWPSLTVPLSSIHAYLDWEENRHWLLQFIWSHVLWRSPLLAVAQTAVFSTSWKEGNYQTKKT